MPKEKEGQKPLVEIKTRTRKLPEIAEYLIEELIRDGKSILSLFEEGERSRKTCKKLWRAGICLS